jgi:pyrroloquinoline quinone (PQQ) biosynthesis protein C
MNDTKFQKYIAQWGLSYQQGIQKIPLFQNEVDLNNEQIKDFIRTFYHLRGHFYKLLWMLGSYKATTSAVKNLLLQNLDGEFGGDKKSHDRLYLDFAMSHGIDLSKEPLEENFYLQFAKNYNDNHIRFILNQSFEACWGMFSAYEYLDNEDYSNLYNLSKKFTAEKDLVFFKVHMNANHFASTLQILEKVYLLNPNEVELGFDFVMNTQLEMWQELSGYILKDR